MHKCFAELIRIQGLTLGLMPMSPTTGYQRNRQTKEWIMWGQWRQAYTQTRALCCGTLEVRSKIGRFDTCNGNEKSARAFPGVTESSDSCLMPSKQAEHCIPDRWPCHSVKPQSHQACDQFTTYLRPQNVPIVERTYDWWQRSYDWWQRWWVIARGKSVATSS